MGSVRLVNYEENTRNMNSNTKCNFNGETKDPLLQRNYSTNKARLCRADTPYIRAVSKSGECNIYPTKVQKGRFIRDIFTTLVDLKWRYIITIFLMGFILSWTLFANMWWLIAFYHGDLEETHLPPHQASSNWTPCVTDIYDFTSCFLFSVETQQTTGYGEKRPTEKCFDAVLLMCLQNVFGLIVEAFLVGVFFAKLVRPKNRAHTIQFSKYALISMREGSLCLIFRLGDVRKKSRILEPTVKAQLITQKTSAEGELFSNILTKLPLTIDECETDLLLIWPVTVVHKISPLSPLYNMSKTDLIEKSFEIIVSLEGTIESTDKKTQARTSYLPCEILWGQRFKSIMTICKEKCGYKVDYSLFDDTEADDTPVCSAAEINSLYNDNNST